MTKQVKKRKYNSEQAARTRQINRERKSKGLPTLAQERKARARRYKYTMAYAGKSGKFREFKGTLGQDARVWRKRSKYAYRVKSKKELKET